jgi:excisionase family DNA binding protein
MAKDTLTTNEAAAALGVSTPRIRQMVNEGLLVAEKFGRDLAISAASVKDARHRKTQPGPAPKSKADVTASRAAKKKAISRWENEGGAVPKGKKKGSKK